MMERHFRMNMLLAMAYFLLVFLTGCKTKTVTVPEYHTEYVVRTDTVERTDSVFQKDSVWVYQRGDTVYKGRLVFLDRYKYRYRTKTDTFIRRDTVYLPKPAERSLSKWEQRYINLGKYAMGAIVSIISVIICLAVWRWHKKKFINENNND